MLTNAQLGSALWELRRAERFLHQARVKADERYYERRIRTLENYIEMEFDEMLDELERLQRMNAWSRQ